MTEPETTLRGRLAAALRRESTRRWLALGVLCLGVAMLVMDYVHVPVRDFREGEVAEIDVQASDSFEVEDWDETLAEQRKAEAAVLPVYDFDATLDARLQSRVSGAFDHARRAYAEALLVAQTEGAVDVSEEKLAAISAEFLQQLELSLDPVDLLSITTARWHVRVERFANDFIGKSLSRYVVADRSLLPSPQSALSVIRLLGDSRDEVRLDDYEQIRTPEEARQAISLYVVEQPGQGNEALMVRAAAAVARAAVRPNFSYNLRATEERRRDARDSVPPVVTQVQRGTAILRKGDVVTRQQVDMINAWKQSRPTTPLPGVIMALVSFSGLLFGSLYLFGSGFIRKFSTRGRDVEAVAFITLLVLAMTRLAVELGEPLAETVGGGMPSSSLWYLAPIAGGAMLTRILVNSETSLMFLLPASILAGVMMDQQVLYTVFFVVGGVTAAGGISHTRERVNVLRAGVQTGLVNVAAALIINLVQVHIGDAPAEAGAGIGLLWNLGFAFMGGIVSAFLVLGLVPMFELFGFVTDYKLLELANLNHPLLRQLMLRAPGTYHHSVIVGSLAEAAAEAISCNALLTRVACYFHDIGKAVSPKYFIENQRDVPNPHDRMRPHQSVRMIVSHVVDGHAIAQQYKLPRPICDNIVMHHGTGIIHYFYAKALEEAAELEGHPEVDPDDYRYPGPKPDTREAGIIMLADKVEAACRAIKDPTPEKIKAMIQSLVNSTVQDGQLEECPLTLQELYTIVETFTNVLLGIYHHRIEYPGVPRRPLPVGGGSGGGKPIITLDLPNPLDEAVPAANGSQPEDAPQVDDATPGDETMH